MTTSGVLCTALTAMLFSSALMAAQPEGPLTPVVILDQGLAKLLVTPASVPFAQRYAGMLPAIDQAFDMGAILRAIVGPGWASLGASDQQALLISFRRYTAVNYVVNFSSGDGTVIRLPSKIQPAGLGELVSTLIVPSSGEPTKISYLVKPTQDTWRITDIYLDGTISQVAVQRSDFRSLLQANGAGPLIERLNRKVVELSGGALKP